MGTVLLPYHGEVRHEDELADSEDTYVMSLDAVEIARNGSSSREVSLLGLDTSRE